MGAGADLTRQEYRNLAEFRRQIRQFVFFSESMAKQFGLEPKQHQLLLALRGLPEDVSPTIGELASRLFIKHHSAVELVDRLAAAGYVVRAPGQRDRREVHLRMSPSGAAVLRQLSLAHRLELNRSGPALAKALQSVIRNARSSPATEVH